MNIIHFVSRITVQKERNVRQGFEAGNSHRSKGRPHKALVTREKIAKAALTIVGEEGYEKLTMARIARRLNVGTSALYNHLSGKDDLLALIEDAVMEQVECSSLYAALEATPTLSPRDALIRWATSYRDVCARHVPLVRIIALTPISGAPRTVEMYEVLARVLKLTGLPSSAIMPRIVALESFIYGSAYDVHAPEDIFDLPVDSEARAPALADARGAFSPDASMAESQDQRNPYADEPFRLGLEALLSDLPDEKNS